MDPGQHDLTATAVGGHTRQRLLADLATLVSFPSVSAQPRHAGDCEAAAAWLARRLRTAGLPRVSIIATAGAPVVVASSVTASPTWSRPHVLVYAHYDVQPADASRWCTAPFTLTLRGDDAHGRGAADDKGPLLAHVAAVESLVARGRLPVDVSFVFDGEEEIGSPHLAGVLRRLADRLTADVAIVSDTRMIAADRPALVESLRGSVSLDVTIQAPFPALHVGQWAGAVRGAATALADVVSSLHDRDGHVAVQDFYAGVSSPPFSAHVPSLAGGEQGLLGLTVEQLTTQLPALAVTRVSAGGQQMAIPDRARARLNARMVVGQDPTRVVAAIEKHILGAVPSGWTVETNVGPGVHAAEGAIRGAGPRAAARAYERAFGRTPEVTRSGGTIAAVSQLRAELALPVVLMGFTLPDARIHAPDERLHLPVFWRAVRASSIFHGEFARLLR
jgi:acetylornithine deacetylase/succinyl-diaminopimelate desuccinylase-like protein